MVRNNLSQLGGEDEASEFLRYSDFLLDPHGLASLERHRSLWGDAHVRLAFAARHRPRLRRHVEPAVVFRGYAEHSAHDPECAAMSHDSVMPLLLTPEEAGELLRTTRKAVYSMVERGQLPGVTRIGRRLLIHSQDLLDFLDHNRMPSSGEGR